MSAVPSAVPSDIPVEKMSALTMDTADKLGLELAKSLPVEAPEKGEGKI